MYSSRAGVFDWLLGSGFKGETFYESWIRDISGMSLRGLIWTFPVGFVMFLLGFGYGYILCGVWMGPVYEFGWIWPKTESINFGKGTAMAEFLWGYFLWMNIIISVINYRK